MIQYDELFDDKLIFRVLENFKTKSSYIVQLSDCKIEINSKWLVINLLFWKILINLDIPIKKEYIYTDKIYSENEAAELHTKIFNEVLAMNDMSKIAKAKDEFWKFHNNFYNFTSIQLAEYQSSLSITDLARIVNQPEIKELADVDFNVDLGTEYVENQLAERSKKLVELLSTRATYKDNALINFLEPGLLNKNQLAPMFIACGVRTDINDVIVRLPIRSNFTTGLQNIEEYVVEHLSAKKSIYYNNMAIKNSQYFSRKQQLAILPIENIYLGDCGSTLLLPFEITSKNKNNVIGKNIVNESGYLEILTKDNIEKYVDTIVRMKSPITCRYRDGVCHTCGGLMMKFLPEKLHIGMQSSSDFTSRVTQLILSNKHFGNTKSLTYQLPDEVVEFLSNRTSGVYFKKEALLAMGSDWKLGIFLKDIRGSLNDINLINVSSDLQEERFSEISGMIVQSASRGEIILPLISGRHVPFFTLEMLNYIKDMKDKVEITDTLVWIPMHKFMPNIPIFRTPIINDSMLEFVRSAQDFVQADIVSYKSASECLKDFSNLIYHKVNVNILNLEILLKAYLITSETDYRVPEVTDINNVIFQKNAKLISNRTISGEFAFQNLWKYITTPSTYLYPKSPGVMDRYFDI